MMQPWIPAAIAAVLCTTACAPRTPGPSRTLAAPSPAAISPPPLDASAPANYPGLPNVVAYAPGVYSGAMPEGDEGFDKLKSLGIRTVLSVDGQLPDTVAAGRHGLRYVHLPIGYNGMSEARTLEIARAVRDLPGPVYIHCHHGKHRSAAAAAAAAITLGESTSDAALARMHVSGTASNYTGLFACVRAAKAASNADLDNASNLFPPQWHTSGAVERMVEIDDAFDRLNAIRAAGWRPPADHPDLVPVSEAAQLADHFRTLAEIPAFRDQPDGFEQHRAAALRGALALEEALNSPDPGTATLNAHLKAIGTSCVSCHREYRD